MTATEPAQQPIVLDPPTDWEGLNRMLWRDSVDAYGNIRPRIAFRGMTKDYGNLATSIQRIGGSKRSHSGQELEWRERRVIETFANYGREQLPARPTDWDVVILGQHYGLPTRMLDWTSSPYVALFFATEDAGSSASDGIVWCVSRVDTTEILTGKIRQTLSSQSAKIFSVDGLRDAFPGGFRQFDGEVAPESLIWIEPPSLDQRIVNQFAIFSTMPAVDSDQLNWLKTHPGLSWGVPVPASMKREIRQRLQVMNITERTIYPGLGGISKWLGSFYS